jgi:hypothetical protein
MLYREIIAVCSEIKGKQINTLCGQNVEFLNLNRWCITEPLGFKMLRRVLPSAVYTERLRVPFAFMTCLFIEIYFLFTDAVVKRNTYCLLSSKPLTTHNGSAVFAVCKFIMFWKLCETTKILTDY